MAFIGSLITTVKANTGPFRKDMKKAGKRAKAFKKKLKGLAIGGAKFGAVLGGVAVAALVAYTVKAFRAIDATKKLADELEIATSELISYQLAAGLSGTNTETLNKALQRMARTVGEARSGITTGTKALEDFGIEVEELQGLTTAEIFETFAQKISEIEDPLERAAKSALIFGKAGQKLLNFLALGKDGLAAVKREAEELGLAFNEVDARKVEEANDAILKMTTVADGLGNTLAISVAPLLTTIADKMSDFIKEAGGIDTLVKGGLNDFRVMTIQIVDVIKLGEAAWNLFSATARAAIALIIQPLVKLDQTTRGFLRLLDKDVNEKGLISLFSEDLLKRAEQDIKEAEQAYKDFEEAALSQKLNNFLSDVSDKSQEIAENIEKSKKSQEGLTTSAKAHAKALAETAKIEKERQAELKQIASEVQRIFEETRTPLEKIKAEIKSINELFNLGAFEGLEGAFFRKLAELEKAKREIEEALGIGKGEVEKGIGAEQGKIDEKRKTAQEAFLNGIFGGIDKVIADAPKIVDQKKREGSFREIDVKNINIAGLTGLGADQKKDIEKKQLEEQKEGNLILRDIAKNVLQNTPVAL